MEIKTLCLIKTKPVTYVYFLYLQKQIATNPDNLKKTKTFMCEQLSFILAVEARILPFI